MDHELSKAVQWCLLKVDNDELASVPGHLYWDLVGWSDSQARSKREHEIRVSSSVESAADDCGLERLPEVDDTIAEFTIASGVVARPASLVVFVGLSCSDSEVSHIVLAALLANLEIGVAVQLVNLF